MNEVIENSSPKQPPESHQARRVWVVGSCGCGKTTVAKKVGDVLAIPSAHVDDYIWLPGWKLREREEMLGLIENRLEEESWVMEGNLGRDATRLWAIADRADLILWLDLPFRVTFWRLVRRCLRRSLLRQECCNGNRESLRQSFFSSQSILLYAFRTRHLRRVIYRHMLRHRPHIRLRSTREVEGWLAAFEIGANHYHQRYPLC
ncbi:MAG: adenylate kinase family enzyme [Candidatus Paceibacteria bacterium]